MNEKEEIVFLINQIEIIEKSDNIDYEKIIVYCNRLIELKNFVSEKNVIATYIMRGNSYSDLKQYHKAIENYNEVIKIDSNFVDAYINRGNNYNYLKQYDEALSDLNKVIVEFKVEDANAYINRGNIYHNLKRYDEAIEDFNKAMKLNSPNLHIAYNSRALVYEELKRYDEAIEDYNKAIELNPSFFEVYSNLANSYSEIGQHTKAIENYDIAIELNSDFTEGYYNRGTYYLLSEEYEKAIENFNTAININPNFVDVYNNIGVSYFKLKQNDKAIENYNKAIELNDNSARIYYNRGCAYFKNPKTLDKAIEDIKKAHELDDSFPDYIEGLENFSSDLFTQKKDKDETYYSPKDILAYFNSNTGWEDKITFKNMKQFDGEWYLNEKGVFELIKSVGNITKERKINFIKFFKKENQKSKMINSLEDSRKEIECIERIEDKLDEYFNLDYERQYYVWNDEDVRKHKKIDLYIITLNLAIEYDEHYHEKPEQQQKDREREEFIKQQLPNIEFFRIKEGQEFKRGMDLVFKIQELLSNI